LLVIVSDGHYVSTESENAKKAIAECERNGVGVLWVTPKECSGGGAESLIGKSSSAQQITTTDTKSIAREIGKSVVKSLEKIGGRV
jgi:hypothetical protein